MNESECESGWVCGECEQAFVNREGAKSCCTPFRDFLCGLGGLTLYKGFHDDVGLDADDWINDERISHLLDLPARRVLNCRGKD